MTEGIQISPQGAEVGSLSVGNVVRKFIGKTIAPTVDNDIDQGYIVSDVWLDETADTAYVCLDNTNGAAVWRQIDATATPASHTIASHSDTTATGTELETLTDGSDADALHDHDGISENTAARHTQGTDTALGAVGTKDPPIDADKAIYRDSTASDVLVTSTWTQVKAFLKTYFDTLYNNYVHPNHSGDVTSVADGAQTIAADAVTYAKMQNVSATMKILGRTTAGAGDVEELSFLDEDDMVSDSAVALATQQSTKKYADDNAVAFAFWLGG